MRTLYMISLCLITGLYLSTMVVAQGCSDGFSFDGRECKDENECDVRSNCGDHAWCINTIGSYYCNCLEGFRSSKENFTAEDPKCLDEDECNDSYNCGPHSRCINTIGSYYCNCLEGFRSSKEKFTVEDFKCRDINECLEGRYPCGPDEKCMNTLGSYKCECRDGYRKSARGDLECSDVDECVESPLVCGPNGTCKNTPGSYICTCTPGFRYHDINNTTTPCEDVDECVESPLVCGPNGTCTNTPGSYTCTCQKGFGNHGNTSSGTCEELVTMLKKDCQDADVDCKLDFLNASVSSSLTKKTVSSLLDVLLDSPPDSLASKGDAVLQSTEDLVSTLVKPTATESRTSFTTNTTEVNILSIGPNTSLAGMPKLVTADVSVDIDLLGIAGNNNGSASVVVIVYNNMQKALNSTFFKTQDNKTANVISKVVSVILPSTPKETIPTPINISIPHFENADAEGEVLCVHWEANSWIQDGCHGSTKSTHTICSCQFPSTFALIMTMDPTQKSDPMMNILNTILVLIGLLFLTLAVMTFALCRWNPRVSNVARLNLCVCLLLAHTLFLLTQSFLRRIRMHQALCKTLAGVLHFLFLSSFVWMSIEAVMLFLSVRKLRQVKPSERAWLQWKVSVPIGYGIPLIIVGVSAGVNPEGHGSDKCWLVEGFKWSFLGPVCFLLAVNTMLFIIIIVTIQSTLKEVRSDVSKVKYTRVLLFKLTVQFLILGCPWLLGMGAARSRVLEVLFLFLTSQQGTAIFLIHCLLNTEVRCQYRKWWQRFGPSSKQPESGAGTGTVSISLTQQPSKDT